MSAARKGISRAAALDCIDWWLERAMDALTRNRDSWHDGFAYARYSDARKLASKFDERVDWEWPSWEQWSAWVRAAACGEETAAVQ